MNPYKEKQNIFLTGDYNTTDLAPVLLEIILWSVKYDKENTPAEAKKFAGMIKKGRDKLIEEISGRLKKEGAP